MTQDRQRGGNADYSHLQAFRDGRSAYYDGAALQDNPHRLKAGHVVPRNAWAAGWRDAHEKARPDEVPERAGGGQAREGA